MNQQEFEDTLRQFKHAEPFEPFVVELDDGRLIEIDGVGLDIDGRGASWVSKTNGFVKLTSDKVRAIRKLTAAEFPRLAAEIARKHGRSEAGMHPTQFDETLRKLIRGKPFVPFVVELLDGRRIFVAEPTVSFDSGAATYLGDSTMEIFYCEDVRTIRPESQGAVA